MPSQNFAHFAHAFKCLFLYFFFQSSDATMKYILVTGGVISGIGKGIIASSLGTILKSCGLHVTAIKIDPYINIDAGTFSPYEHGEHECINSFIEIVCCGTTTIYTTCLVATFFHVGKIGSASIVLSCYSCGGRFIRCAGEVFVLDDGGEVDLDLGNYERFLDIRLTKENNLTTGKIYQSVINKERKGDYLGKTVQGESACNSLALLAI